MSPNEAQLRAALQEGEGDSPDATHLISHAMRVRYDRRRRITSIAGGVAAAAVIGVGLTALVTSGSDSESASSEAGGGASTQGDAHGAAGPAGAAGSSARQQHALAPASGNASSSASVPKAYAAPSPARGAVSALKCPATPDRFMLPGGGGSGQFGSGDPLFPQPVAVMKACAYPQRVGAQPRAQIYRAPVAGQIATALDAAADTKSDASCPANTDYVGGQIEILAVDAHGKPLKPVVVTLGCRLSQTTNGTAVRYVADLPNPLLRLLAH